MALTIRVAANDADLTAINTLLTTKATVTGSGATVTYGAKTLTDTAGAFLSLPGTIVGMTVTVGAKVGTIASRTATVITLTANWSGGAPAAQSAYSIAPGFSIRDELLADFTSVIPFTLQAWHPMLSDINARVVMGFQPANTLRGACYWTNEMGVWTCRLVGIDKSLTASARLSGARDFFVECASRVPPETVVTGILKQNGKLHTWLSPQLPAGDFTLLANSMVKVTTTAQRLAGIV